MNYLVVGHRGCTCGINFVAIVAVNDCSLQICPVNITFAIRFAQCNGTMEMANASCPMQSATIEQCEGSNDLLRVTLCEQHFQFNGY